MRITRSAKQFHNQIGTISDEQDKIKRKKRREKKKTKCLKWIGSIPRVSRMEDVEVIVVQNFYSSYYLILLFLLLFFIHSSPTIMMCPCFVVCTGLHRIYMPTVCIPLSLSVWQICVIHRDSLLASFVVPFH